MTEDGVFTCNQSKLTPGSSAPMKTMMPTILKIGDSNDCLFNCLIDLSILFIIKIL